MTKVRKLRMRAASAVILGHVYGVPVFPELDLAVAAEKGNLPVRG